MIDAINREGIGNEAWGLVEEVDDTVAYFGTREEIELKGQWAYVYADKKRLLRIHRQSRTDESSTR